MAEIKVDFTDIIKIFNNLTEEQKEQFKATEKDWQWIKQVIYLEAKKYTSKETAEKISQGCMDFLIANGVCLKTPKSVKHNTVIVCRGVDGTCGLAKDPYHQKGITYGDPMRGDFPAIDEKKS